MKTLVVFLGIGLIASGCSSTLPKGAVADAQVGDGEQAISDQSSPLDTIGDVLEATRFETLPRLDSAQAEQASVPGPSGDSDNRPIRTVGELLADPQFKAVVAALEGAKQ
ncbi:MAG: hypothetical protein J0L84_04715 [Verrucomicrobia bacterium]|nr:hypothetical protein [Verrucomicrobiota bacterium]